MIFKSTKRTKKKLGSFSGEFLKNVLFNFEKTFNKAPSLRNFYIVFFLITILSLLATVLSHITLSPQLWLCVEALLSLNPQQPHLLPVGLPRCRGPCIPRAEGCACACNAMHFCYRSQVRNKRGATHTYGANSDIERQRQQVQWWWWWIRQI